MTFVKRLTPGTLIAILVGTCTVASLTLGIVAMRASSALQFGGPTLDEVACERKLVSEILPPPHCIVESCARTAQLLQTSDATERGNLIGSLVSLKAEYLASQTRWQEFRDSQANTSKSASLINRDKVLDLYDSLLIKSHEPAVPFFAETENQFVPALRAGNQDTVNHLFTTVLKPAYKKHRAAIDDTLKLAGQYNQSLESIAKSEERRVALPFSGLLALVTLSFCGIGVFLIPSSVPRNCELGKTSNRYCLRNCCGIVPAPNSSIASPLDNNVLEFSG